MQTIWQRTKTPKGWRYRSIEEGRGKRTGELQPPFYVRPSVNGSQSWQRLNADSFADAKQESEQFESVLDAAARGLTVAEAENVANLNRTTIKTAIATYLDQKRSKAKRTVAVYTYYLNEFLESLGNRVRFVDQITPDVLRQFKDFLTAKGYSGRTIRTRMDSVYFMLKKNGVTARLPKDEMPIIEIEVAVPYRQDELDKLFAAMDDEQRIRYKFFLGSGCRAQEVTFASWNDIDFTKREYHIRQKPDAGFTPKSHESRTVSLPASLIEALKARRASHPNDRWLFTNADGNPDNHFLHKLKRIALHAGLNCGNCATSLHKWGRSGQMKIRHVTCKTAPVCEHIFLHRFRKTCATRWAAASDDQGRRIPLRTIQMWLGHKDLATTQRYLGAGDSDELRPQIDRAFGD